MEIITIILMSGTLIYFVWRGLSLADKVADQEEYIEELEEMSQYMYNQIENSYNALNNIDSRGQTNNIIASIVNNTNYGGYIFFVPPEVLYYQITEQNISHLDIELTDQEGKLLEMNKANFNLTLTIHYVKQRVSQFRNSLLREIRESYNPEIKEEEKK